MPSSVDLGPRLEGYVTELVENGRYNSRSEALREGVRLIEEREKRLTLLDLAMRRGLADANAGRMTSTDQVARRLLAKYRPADGSSPA